MKGWKINIVVALLAVSFVLTFSPLGFTKGEKIAFWSFPSAGGFREKIIPYIQEFERKANVKVELTVVPWGGGNQKILAAIAGGNPPDVMLTTRSRILPLVNFGNAIEPLNQYVEEDNLREKIVSDLALNEYTFGEKIYGVGWRGDGHFWSINLDAFRKAGISDVYIQKMSDPDKVWTWIDFIYLVHKLTVDINGDGEPDQWGYSYPGGSKQASPFLHLYWNVGGHVVNPEGEVGIGDYYYTLPVFELLNILQSEGLLPPGTLTLDPNETDNLFLQGKIGIYVGFPGSSYITQKKAGEKLPEFKIVYPPKAPTGERGNFYAWNALCMSAASKYKSTAWEFIKWYVTSDTMHRFVLNELPGGNHATGISPEEVKEPLFAQALAVANEMFKRGWYLRHEPAHAASDRIMRAYNTATQYVLIGKKSPVEATDWLRQKALQAVKEVE